MLIAFVLLGRNLEQRAKIKATSDMTGLLSSLPSQARLMVDDSIVEVPCSSLSVGDQIVVLPGDRVPADGIVRAGRSTIDESSFTGEPMPVTKEPGSQVAAGSINLNGTLTIEVRRPGGETAMGDIVRLVEEAQSREAPVQRWLDTSLMELWLSLLLPLCSGICLVHELFQLLFIKEVQFHLPCSFPVVFWLLHVHVPWV